MSTIAKQFILKYTFDNVATMEENKEQFSKEENYFNISWQIRVSRRNGYLAIALGCMKSCKKGKWNIDMQIKIKTEKTEFESKYWFGNIDGDKRSNMVGKSQFFEWEKMKKNHLLEGKLAVEIHVSITKMVGIYKENLRCFDESMKAFSDITLVVGEQKFYVSKLFLATHSSYFNSLFLGKFKEAKKSKITLTGIDADDFQNYLEVLYGDSAIDETTIEGLLILGDMYDTQIVIKKCEEFLIEKSKKTMKKKLELSIRYNMENLKKKCISEVNTKDKIREIFPLVHQMDKSVAIQLLEKSLSMQ